MIAWISRAWRNRNSTGQVATLDIPKKLEGEDAERLAEFVLSLAAKETE